MQAVTTPTVSLLIILTNVTEMYVVTRHTDVIFYWQFVLLSQDWVE